MDITVKPENNGATWQLIDLLGRSMGIISHSQEGFTVLPGGHALQTMRGMNIGPFRSLDEALAEIEKHTRGTCRMAANPATAIPTDDLNASNDE
jgi:hypothetical protein